MGWVTAIGSLIMAVLKALPILDKWFSKSVTQKVEEKQAELRDEIDDFKKTGRPS
jgi:hypothetical protein